MRKITIALSLITVLLTQNSAQSATRLVPDEYRSIQRAINDCNNGDTVIVSPGTYYETINFGGKNITVTSTNPDDPEVVAETIIDADGDGSTVTFENGETPQAVLTGFTITGGFGTRSSILGGDDFKELWGGGIYCLQASPTITANVITGNNCPAVLEGNQEDIMLGLGSAIGGAVSNAVITRNIIHGNTAYAGAGIFIVGNPEIRNNLIYDNSAFIAGGIIMAGGVLSNNTIADNDASFMGGAQAGGNIYIIFDDSFGQMQITNNIICNARSGGGIFWEGTYQEGTISFNNVWNNTPGNYGSTSASTMDGPFDKTGINGNISQDPLFVNAEERDYHLQLESPCINAGNPNHAISRGETDFEDNARVYGEVIDIGAYEYEGYVRPIADAGPDQQVDRPRLITLDGSASLFYDPAGVRQFSWTQVGGDPVVLNNPTSVNPTFTPESEGEYRFELVVSDSLYSSDPDEVIILIQNRPPVADAGPDQSTSDIPQIVTLDGSASYDPGDEPLTYRWRQIDGPAVELTDENTVTPSFVPLQEGIYVFELIVNDGQLDSEPDTIGIVIGNHAPVADAGLPRYAGFEPVILDGRSSFDPDEYGFLTYQWQQVSGPSLDITGSNESMPTVSGFVQTSGIQRCEFELIVSDGDLSSRPDIVEIVIVPDFGENYPMQSDSFDPNKPTILAFGGGDCTNGGSLTFPGSSDWPLNANLLTFGSYGPPYSQYADSLIAYLSILAPNYTQPIHTTGFSTGNMPAIDVANRMNNVYADARYAVNRISFLDTACRDYVDDIATFLASSVDGEACWIDNYFATEGRFYPGTLNIRFPAPQADHSTPAIWYLQSHDRNNWPSRGGLYNGGITAGYYISVAGQARNFRPAPDVNDYYFEWDSQTGYIGFHNEAQYPNRILEIVPLIGPEDGASVDAGGAVLTCGRNRNAVVYQLLFGPSPDRMNYLVSETSAPPNEMITTFPFETTYWTVRISDQYGATTYADPIRIKSQNVTAQTIENTITGKRYTSIQSAINDAENGQEIIVAPGIYQRFENINFKGKNITLRSQDPNDQAIVAATVIRGGNQAPVVSFSGGESTNCVLSGVTICGGTTGIHCLGAIPTITKCVITNNNGAGIKSQQESNPTITNCIITHNMGAGIEMSKESTTRGFIYSYATIDNCTIADNLQQGVLGDNPTISNSIIYFNCADCNNVQIESDSPVVTYSNVQGTHPGEGNIDVDPMFANENDYHLKSQAGRWDPASQSWAVDEVTSLCIDAGNPDSDWTAELSPNGQRINMGAYGGTPQASMSQTE